MTISITTDATHRYADRLIEELVDGGPATGAELRDRLEWSKGRFSGARGGLGAVVDPEQR